MIAARLSIKAPFMRLTAVALALGLAVAALAAGLPARAQQTNDLGETVQEIERLVSGAKYQRTQNQTDVAWAMLQKARGLAERLPLDHPAGALPALEIADWWIEANRPDMAVDLYAEVVNRYDRARPPHDEERLQVVLRLSNALMAERRYASAQTILHGALVQVDDAPEGAVHPLVHGRLWHAIRKTAEYLDQPYRKAFAAKQAWPHYQAAVRLKSKDPERYRSVPVTEGVRALMHYGEALEQAGEAGQAGKAYDLAISNLEEATGLEPILMQARANSARTLVALGRGEDAKEAIAPVIAWFEGADRKDPVRHVDAYIIQADAHALLYDDGAAIESLQAATQIAIDHEATYTRAVTLFDRLVQLSAVRQEWDAALEYAKVAARLAEAVLPAFDRNRVRIVYQYQVVQEFLADPSKRIGDIFTQDRMLSSLIEEDGEIDGGITGTITGDWVWHSERLTSSGRSWKALLRVERDLARGGIRRADGSIDPEGPDKPFLLMANAIILVNMRDIPRARRAYREAMDLRAKTPYRSVDQEARSLVWERVMAVSLGLTDQGHAAAEAAWALAQSRSLKDKRTVVWACIQMVASQIEQGRLDEAASLNASCRTMLGDLRADDPIHAWADVVAIMVLRSTGRERAAYQAIPEALRNAQRDWPAYAEPFSMLLQDKASLDAQFGFWSLAAEAFKTAIDLDAAIFPNGGSARQGLYQNYGSLLQTQGRFAEALGVLEKALEVGRKRQEAKEEEIAFSVAYVVSATSSTGDSEYGAILGNQSLAATDWKDASPEAKVWLHLTVADSFYRLEDFNSANMHLDLTEKTIGGNALLQTRFSEWMLSLRAFIAQGQEDFETASDILLALFEKNVADPNRATVGVVVSGSNAAEALYRARRYGEALDVTRTVTWTLRQLFGRTHGSSGQGFDQLRSQNRRNFEYHVAAAWGVSAGLEGKPPGAAAGQAR